MMGRALRPQYFCRFGLISAVMGLVFLSSCSILPKAEKLEIYQLPSSSIPRSAQANSLPWALRIATPKQQPGDRQHARAGTAAGQPDQCLQGHTLEQPGADFTA